MLVNYVSGIETHVNPYNIVETWEYEGQFHVVMNGGENEPAEIDKDSYERIVAWIEAQ